MEIRNWYELRFEDTHKLDTPALLVYPERVRHNLDLLKSMIHDVTRLRPHVKTHKCSEAVLLTLAAGITKFKCATIAEAEMLGRCQAPNVLLAYQPVGPKQERFKQLILAYPATRYSCLIDSLQIAKELSTLAQSFEYQVPVYIDLNVGMNRTGVSLLIGTDEALQLYKDCQKLDGLVTEGLHVYDGHIHEPNFEVRKERCDAYFSHVLKLKRAILNSGSDSVIIVAGGTPTCQIHAERPDVECSPGTFMYWDEGYRTSFSEQHFLCAAVVLTRVISLPTKDTLCLDTGHKAIASEDILTRRIHFLNKPELTVIGHSEEHLTVFAGLNHPYHVGDILYGIPHHICPTVALYERVITVTNHHVTGEWMTVARDRKLTV